MLNTASFAVNCLSLVNFALSTRSKVYVLRSGDTVHDFASDGTILPESSCLTSVSYTFPSSTCGIAAPSVVVKSRLAGSATRPIDRFWSPPGELPDDVLDPAEQAVTASSAADARNATARVENDGFTSTPPVRRLV